MLKKSFLIVFLILISFSSSVFGFTYTTSKNCNDWIYTQQTKGNLINNTWYYSNSQIRKIIEFKQTKLSCKIKYEREIIPKHYFYKTSKSCEKMIGNEWQNGNFDGFCWDKNKAILNIYNNQPKGCIIEYLKGCDNIQFKQDECYLKFGDNNTNHINFVIFSYDFEDNLLPYFIYASNNIISYLTTIEPFSSNKNKFNIYISMKSHITDQQLILIENDTFKGYSDKYDSYLPKVCKYALNKPEDVIYLIDTNMFGWGTVGLGMRRDLSWCKSVSGINGISYYGDFCPAIASSKGTNPSIAMHEIGHAFTLNHDDTTNNFMMSSNLNTDHFEDYQKEIILNELNKFYNTK